MTKFVTRYTKRKKEKKKERRKRKLFTRKDLQCIRRRIYLKTSTDTGNEE